MRLNNVFTIKQNDTLPAVEAVIRTRGALDEIIPFNLSGVTACTFSMADDCGNLTISSSAAQITCSSGGTVQYNWVSGDTEEPGTYSGEFTLLFSGGSVMTIPTVGNINIQILKRIS